MRYPRRFYLVSSLLVTLLACGAASADPPPVCGDVNNTGSVTAADALVVLRLAVGQQVSHYCWGACVETTFGETTDFVSDATFTPNSLLGSAVTIPFAGTLSHLAVISKSTGVNMRMALYTDDGGVPGTLVVGTGVTEMTEGMMEILVPSTAVEVGTYWLMAVYEEQAKTGGGGVAEVETRYRDLAFDQPFPDTFGASSVYQAARQNRYLRVVY